MSIPMITSPKAEAVVAEFRSHATWIRAEIVTSNDLGHPTQALMDFLLDRRINLALVPEHYGGLHFDFRGEFLLISEATRIDSTFGWIVFQLAGNPGRVLSFLEDDVIRALLDETDGRVVFTYQNDPKKGKVELRGDTLIVSGYWFFGTLTDCATHFVIPFIDPRDEIWKCALVVPDPVGHPVPWKSNALKGASIRPYEIKRYELDETDIVAEASMGNQNFNPYYSVPRSAIKHLAWSTGLAQSVLDAVEDYRLGMAFAWSVFGRKLAELLAEIDTNLQMMQDRIAVVGGVSADPTAVDSQVCALKDLCGPVHQFAVDGALQAFIENPVEALDSNSRVSRTLMDSLTLSLHGAIRSEMDFLRDLTRNADMPSAIDVLAG